MIIDPEIFNIFPSNFFEVQLKKYPNIKAIQANHFYYALKNSFGYCCPEDGLIVLDPSVEPKIIAASTNANHPELFLKEDEAFPWIFFHELYHSEKGAGEWSADNFAITKILELRTERQRFYDGVKNLVRETFKKELAR